MMVYPNTAVRASVTFLGLNSLGGSGARQSAGRSEYGVAVVFEGGIRRGWVGRGTRGVIICFATELLFDHNRAPLDNHPVPLIA